MKITHDMVKFAKLVACLTEIGVEFEVSDDDFDYMVTFKGFNEDDDDTDISFNFRKGDGILQGIFVFDNF